MKALIIVPAYNEDGNIGDVINALNRLSISSYKFDTLVINDSSTDRTSEICRDAGVNIIDLPCNLGIGGTVQTGYKYAYKNGYDIAIQFDGDGQHNSEYIKQLLDPILAGNADMVIGSRYIRKEGFQSTFLRRIGIKYFSILIKLLTKKKITDPTSGFRACNNKVIELFALKYPIDYPEPESIVNLLRTNHVIEEVPVLMLERKSGVSSIRSFKSIYYMVKVSLAIVIDILRNNQRKEVI